MQYSASGMHGFIKEAKFYLDLFTKVCYNKLADKQEFVGEYMNNVNKTLYIYLHSKSYVSKNGCFLSKNHKWEIGG